VVTYVATAIQTLRMIFTCSSGASLFLLIKDMVLAAENCTVFILFSLYLMH